MITLNFNNVVDENNESEKSTLEKALIDNQSAIAMYKQLQDDMCVISLNDNLSDIVEDNKRFNIYYNNDIYTVTNYNALTIVRDSIKAIIFFD